MVTRTPIYTALATVQSIESVKKILAHKFYSSYYSYHYEDAEYLNMMKVALTKAGECIKKGNSELVGVIEDCFLMSYKDFHLHFGRDKQLQALLQVLRDCYISAGQREKRYREFHEGQSYLIVPQDGIHPQRDDIRRLYFKAALWRTVEDVKEDFTQFDTRSSLDRTRASWYCEIPYTEVSACARALYEEMFPPPTTITKGRERRRQAFSDFSVYEVFKQIVLEMVTGLYKHSSRKEHYNKLRDRDEGYNLYAYRFLLLFANENDTYDIGRIVKYIKDKDFYNSFFMREVSELLDRHDSEIVVNEEVEKRIVECARALVLKLCEGQHVFFGQEAIELLLKGKFEIERDKLPKILDFGRCKISRQDIDGFYSQEYSLFDYIAERVDVATLTPVVEDRLRKYVGKEGYPLSYDFSNYIIEHQIEDCYGLALRFALTGYSMSTNIMESLIKKGIRIDDIKKASSSLNVSNKLSCYSMLVKNSQESEWVRVKLESEYKSFSGYHLKQAVHLLISIGSMDALVYLTKTPEMLCGWSDYLFNYDTPNAIPSLCFFIRYYHENKWEDPFMLNSILSSLERIASKDKDALIEVKQYLRQLTQRGEDFKYLNRYIISFEDKYYVAYSGVSDISEAMKLVDGTRKAMIDNDDLEAKPWSENEGVYISYNWEGHSPHIVDYLCFVLESRGIPFKYDKNDCNYADRIKDFMDSIRAGKTVILVLSRPYLRSKNCMYELSGVLEDHEYKNRLLPVVVDDTIRDDEFYVELVTYWKEQKDKQSQIVDKLRAVDPDMAEPQEVKLREISQVYDLLKVIKDYIDWANADNLDALCASRFKRIIDEIFLRRGKK